MPVPFRVGEILKYQVSWASFNTAASVELSVPERRELCGWPTWHFRAAAHTLSPVRSLFTIDDQFDSYTDGVTGEVRQYEVHLSEMGKSADRIWRFVVEGQTPRVPGGAVIVLPGTRDPLGALYALRSNDWQSTPEVRMPVYDGHDLYDLRARLAASNDPVQVPAGKFSASRIAVQLFQSGKEVSGISFAAWIANGAARAPVLMTAELPFGSLRVEMLSANQ